MGLIENLFSFLYNDHSCSSFLSVNLTPVSKSITLYFSIFQNLALKFFQPLSFLSSLSLLRMQIYSGKCSSLSRSFSTCLSASLPLFSLLTREHQLTCHVESSLSVGRSNSSFTLKNSNQWKFLSKQGAQKNCLFVFYLGELVQ